jgi:hypothetical protein
MFDIAYRDMSDTVPVASFGFDVGGSIVLQMAFGLAPRSARRMKKPLVRFALRAAFRMWGMRVASIVPTLL